MITRTFTKSTYTLKGITADDEMKSISVTLWDFEIPSGKRALKALFTGTFSRQVYTLIDKGK